MDHDESIRDLMDAAERWQVIGWILLMTARNLLIAAGGSVLAWCVVTLVVRGVWGG